MNALVGIQRSGCSVLNPHETLRARLPIPDERSDGTAPTHDSARSIVDECPRASAIESADTNGRDELWIEIPKVNTVLAARRRLQWLPVRDTATRPATDRAQRSVSLDVLRR
jgi:hypothetical protein